jgi:hypothetical protein
VSWSHSVLEFLSFLTWQSNIWLQACWHGQHFGRWHAECKHDLSLNGWACYKAKWKLNMTNICSQQGKHGLMVTSVTRGRGGAQKSPFKIVETYWYDHSLESSWGELSEMVLLVFRFNHLLTPPKPWTLLSSSLKWSSPTCWMWMGIEPTMFGTWLLTPQPLHHAAPHYTCGICYGPLTLSVLAI